MSMSAAKNYCDHLKSVVAKGKPPSGREFLSLKHKDHYVDKVWHRDRGLDVIVSWETGQWLESCDVKGKRVRIHVTQEVKEGTCVFFECLRGVPAYKLYLRNVSPVFEREDIIDLGRTGGKAALFFSRNDPANNTFRIVVKEAAAKELLETPKTLVSIHSNSSGTIVGEIQEETPIGVHARHYDRSFTCQRLRTLIINDE